MILDIGVDDYAIRVRCYEVRPPTLERPNSVDSTWRLHGTDDLGGEYESSGGAFGLSTEGTLTEGVHSLEPLPAAAHLTSTSRSWAHASLRASDRGT